MPIYEFECEKHGVFEMVMPMNRSDITEIVCDAKYSRKGKRYRCNRLAQRVWSLTNMQPDKYWAGHIVHGKYVTKKSQINPNVEPLTRNKKEYVKKRYTQAVAEKEEKHRQDVHKFLTQELKQYDIGPDGATIKQRRKYASARSAAS